MPREMRWSIALHHSLEVSRRHLRTWVNLKTKFCCTKRQGYSQLGSAVRFCGCQTRKKQKLTNQASSKYISLPLAGGNCFICQFCPKLFCSSLLNTPQFELQFSQLRCLAGKRSAPNPFNCNPLHKQCVCNTTEGPYVLGKKDGDFALK